MLVKTLGTGYKQGNQGQGGGEGRGERVWRAWGGVGWGGRA